MVDKKVRWHKLELFRVFYPDDDDFDKLDELYSGHVGYIAKDKKGRVIKVIIARTWPRDVSDEDETGIYSSDE